MRLDKSSKTYLRYCEMGLKSRKNNKNGDSDEQNIFADLYCTMVMCIPSWNNKIAEKDQVKEQCGARAIRFSARKKV